MRCANCHRRRTAEQMDWSNGKGLAVLNQLVCIKCKPEEENPKSFKTK